MLRSVSLGFGPLYCKQTFCGKSSLQCFIMTVEPCKDAELCLQYQCIVSMCLFLLNLRASQMSQWWELARDALCCPPSAYLDVFFSLTFLWLASEKDAAGYGNLVLRLIYISYISLFLYMLFLCLLLFLLFHNVFTLNLFLFSYKRAVNSFVVLFWAIRTPFRFTKYQIIMLKKPQIFYMPWPPCR